MEEVKESICIELYKKYREQFMYLIFGGLTTVINWLVYTGLILLKQEIEFSNIIAWIMAVLFAYITNRKFVFQSKQNEKQKAVREFFMFFGSRVLTGIVEIVGFPILYYIGLNQAILGIDGLFAKIIISIVVIILNYILSKKLVFKK